MVNLTIWSNLIKWMEGTAWGSTNRWEIVLIILLVIVVLLVIIFSYLISDYESKLLKMKAEPHTMRNMFEELRVKIKKLNKKAKEMKSDDSLVDEVVNQINQLYEQINRDSDFLSYIAETNESEQNLAPISKELEFAGRLIERFGMDESLFNIENRLEGDIKIPSMITQSMIENAFKYGDKTMPGFLSVSFAGPDNNKKYVIQVKNKVNDTFDSEVYSTKQGIKNLVERIDNYNSLNDDNYSATPKRALKNGYYIFKIEFEPKS